jgi:hypothetical protein
LGNEDWSTVLEAEGVRKHRATLKADTIVDPPLQKVFDRSPV